MLTPVVELSKDPGGMSEHPLAAHPAASARRLAGPNLADACYFRSTAPAGKRKVLIKITDRCDLRCAHCFVSATAAGSDMNLSSLTAALPRLQAARVATVTLTGGEPLVHPELLSILTLLRGSDFDVTICTNGVSLTVELIETAHRLGNIKFNVSLDGLSRESHGKFRGNRESFDITLAHTRRLADEGLLKGILSTPNKLADVSEYEQLYALVTDLGADYLLMNPLSSFGRGINSHGRLRADTMAMVEIESRITARRDSRGPEAVYIRFPNESRPLTSCIAGDLFYVFVNGEVTVCPYLVFATENPGAKHRRPEFIVGNLFEDDDIAERLDSYDFAGRYPMGTNSTCRGCGQSGACGKGCPAAVIASGGRIGDLDRELCPITSITHSSECAECAECDSGGTPNEPQPRSARTLLSLPVVIRA